MHDRSMHYPDDYLSSGFAVHDAIMQKAERIIETLPASMFEKGMIEPFVVFWPEKDLNGRDYEVVLLELPAQYNTSLLRAAKEKTHAAGMCLVTSTEKEVTALVETPLGTKSWIYRVQYQGGSRALSLQALQENVQSTGVFWLPKAN